MTPIKAAAEPNELLALAQELRCARAETLGSNGKIRMPIELIVHCEAILSKLAAAPAGSAGVRQKPFAWVMPGSDTANDRGFIDAMAWEEGEFTKPLYALPQPREAFADEIKRADAAPPEASFDNASDMLGYLNAPREAGPVTDDELFKLAAAAWETQTDHPWFTDALEAAVYAVRERLSASASRSPIPEAPGGREIARAICCPSGCRYEGDSEDGCKCYCDTSDFNGSGIERKTNAVLRAIKPQDGGESGR